MNGAVSSSAQGHWYSHSCVLSVHLLFPPFLYFDPMIIAHQGPLSMEFSRQEYQSGLPGEDPGDLPKPGIELPSLYLLCCLADSLPLSHQGSPSLFDCWSFIDLEEYLYIRDICTFSIVFISLTFAF